MHEVVTHESSPMEEPHDWNLVATFQVFGDEKGGIDVCLIPIVCKRVRRLVFGEAHFAEPLRGSTEPFLPILVVEALSIFIWNPIFFELFCSWPVEQLFEFFAEVLVDDLGVDLYVLYNILWIVPLETMFG
jgi:hypothetical protein